ncbi:MAG: type II toxin-antitoxin system ParD family antitoxin [Gammaproteobacteria bacterium]
MTRKTITITNKQEEYVRAQIESGDYGNDSEYFRDLVRRDQTRNKAEAELRRMLEKTEAGGISKRTVEEIWAAAEERYRAKNG